MKKWFLQKRIFGIKIQDYLIVLSMYVFFAYTYHLTLWFNRLHAGAQVDELFDFHIFMAKAGLDYLVKLGLTIPIWWLVFVKLKNITLIWRLLFHIIGLPLFVFLFQQIYYYLCSIVDFGHLASYGQVWDLYIPGLFYFIQFGIFHAYEYYHSNQKNLMLRIELGEAALKSELAALKAQLNPHFLYNVFNTISASVPPEQEDTRELIAKLADLFRYQLKASKVELVTLREELIFVQTYLDLEKARFEDRLLVVIDVPPTLLEHLIPPMLLQPLVENAVKHGISALVEGGQILIKVRDQEGSLAFEISDTGVGLKDKSTLFNRGVGLTNTKLRLEKQYGSKLKISDNQPRGLKVEFAI